MPMDRDIVISYVNLLRRGNIQHLTLVLNQYWAHAAFDLGPINYSKIRDLNKKIKSNAEAILKISQAPACNILKRNNRRKRCSQDGECSGSKKSKT